MCNFHSIIGVAIGDNLFIKHESHNSHSQIAGTIKNLPNRQYVMFEAEWDGEGNIPPVTKLIRNVGECPEKLQEKITAHYQKVHEAITEGRHFDLYFADTEKWADVWCKAIEKGVAPALPAVFKGDLLVYGSAKLEANALTEVGGDLLVYGSAKLEALTKVGGDLRVYGSAKLEANALTEVGGYLLVYGSAKLEANALTEVGGDLRVDGTLIAPKLVKK